MLSNDRFVTFFQYPKSLSRAVLHAGVRPLMTGIGINSNLRPTKCGESESLLTPEDRESAPTISDGLRDEFR